MKKEAKCDGDSGEQRVMSEEEFIKLNKLLDNAPRNLESYAMKDEDILLPKGPSGPSGPRGLDKKKKRFKIIGLRDVLFLGAMGISAALAYKFHGQINDATNCYFSRLTEGVCVVEKKADGAAGQRTYEIRTDRDISQVVYNASTNTVAIPQAYINEELKGDGLDVSQAMSALYQNRENRSAAAKFVLQNLAPEELKSNGAQLAQKLYQADRQAVQKVVLEDLANNPQQNREALVEVSQEGAKMYPADVTSVIPNEDLVSEAKRRGSDTMFSFYEIIAETVRDNYNKIFGDNTPQSTLPAPAAPAPESRQGE